MKASPTGALIAALAVAGCSTASAATGSLEAHRTGDTTHARAPRIPAGARIEQGCGPGVLTAEGEQQIARFPYLQRMTSDSAEILFTTTRGRPSLQITTPDATTLRRIDVERDATAVPGATTQWVARIEGLKPATMYCYELPGLVTRTGFVTAPAAGSGRPTRFVAFGDSGTGGAGQHAVLEQIRTVPFDFIVHTGDVAYRDGTLSEYETKYFAVYRDVLSKFPSFVAFGNHDEGRHDGDVFRSVFSLPTNGGKGAVERRYSFDWGDVHFVSLDTSRIGKAQAEWLDADLNRNRLPWVVVYAHEPPYSSGSHGPNRAFQSILTPVLERHHVDLVLSGHEHDYERFEPIGGVHYVVTGGGGKAARPVGHGAQTAFSESVLHFVYVEVRDETLRLHAIDASGKEFDSLELSHRTRDRG